MYKRVASKLFKKTARRAKVKGKAAKRRAPSEPKKEEKKSLQPSCPHLRSNKTCARMIEEGLDGSLSDFDIKQFCKGNPILCYYFRLAPTEKK